MVSLLQGRTRPWCPSPPVSPVSLLITQEENQPSTLRQAQTLWLTTRPAGWVPHSPSSSSACLSPVLSLMQVSFSYSFLCIYIISCLPVSECTLIFNSYVKQEGLIALSLNCCRYKLLQTCLSIMFAAVEKGNPSAWALLLKILNSHWYTPQLALALVKKECTALHLVLSITILSVAIMSCGHKRTVCFLRVCTYI